VVKRDERPATDEEEIACPHVTLIARWENAEDMGHEDRVSAFRCEACGQEFTPAEATRLRETEAERLRRRLAG
jgi:hypothetical protein